MGAPAKSKFLRGAVAFARGLGLEVEVVDGGRHEILRCRRPGAGGVETVAVHRGTRNLQYVEGALRAQLRAVARGTYAGGVHANSRR